MKKGSFEPFFLACADQQKRAFVSPLFERKNLKSREQPNEKGLLAKPIFCFHPNEKGRYPFGRYCRKKTFLFFDSGQLSTVNGKFFSKKYGVDRGLLLFGNVKKVIFGKKAKIACCFECWLAKLRLTLFLGVEVGNLPKIFLT